MLRSKSSASEWQRWKKGLIWRMLRRLHRLCLLLAETMACDTESCFPHARGSFELVVGTSWRGETLLRVPCYDSEQSRVFETKNRNIKK